MKERKKGQLNDRARCRKRVPFIVNLSIGKPREILFWGKFLGITITRYAGIKYAGINMRGDIIFH